METATVVRIEAPAGRRVGGLQLVAELLSLSPLGVLVAVAADRALVHSAVADLAPKLLGTPAQTLAITLTLLWTAVGAVLIRHRRSAVTQSVALLVFTIPAAVTAVVGPWLALARPW